MAQKQQDETSEAPEVVAALQELPADHPLVKAYEAEKTKRKELREENTTLRTEKATGEKLAELQKTYPFADAELFEGLPMDKWEARAAKIAEIKGETPPETKVETPQPKPEEAALAAAQSLKGTPADGTQQFTAQELYVKLQNKEITDQQMNDMIAAGQMKT